MLMLLQQMCFLVFMWSVIFPTIYNFPRFPMTQPSCQQGQQHKILLPSLPQDQKELGELFTVHVSRTLLDETMAETRSTKWRSTKPIPACFNATINNNASLKK